MNPLTQFKNTTILPVLIPLVLACFGLSPTAQAQLSPPPDGGYPNENTAEGDYALWELTTGHNNMAIGSMALFHNQTGYWNTATGAFALYSNTDGKGNTATGNLALYNNNGHANTTMGNKTLVNNTTGSENTAIGNEALTSGKIPLTENHLGAVDNRALRFEKCQQGFQANYLRPRQGHT